MRRAFSLLILGFSLAAAPQLAIAEVAASSSWLVSLSALLATRYQAIGDLQLSWNRPLSAAAPAIADLAILTAPAELAPQLLVTVRAIDANGKTSDHTLILRAELWRDGWTLREPAAVATQLAASTLESRRYDALRERDAVPADSAAELDFARSVPAGRLIVWRDVIRHPLVRRGQSVDVFATDGSLTVTLRGIALNDAARGETVRIRNPDSKKDFNAQVVADSRASVRF